MIMSNISLILRAHQFAYGMCGSSPCEDCGEFKHITNDEERANYIKCVNEGRCQEAKNYNKEYDDYVKEYMNKN